ncbi:MAG TPA: DinB family protein [Acidimicrobiales bacterium]|jgi:hypothetical protein
MALSDPRSDLHGYLKEARAALRWKLDGLGEYELRRPMTPTGTNLLGTVKHVAIMEVAYFGATFGRPFAEPMPWLEDDALSNSDLWVTADESTGWVLGLYERACHHADQTIEALPLDAVGDVRWWTTPHQTLHKILVHMVAETHRHAGQLDIVREAIDGSAGYMPGDECMPDEGAIWWSEYRAQVEAAALQAAAL